MEIPESGSPATELPREPTNEHSRSFVARKNLFSIAMPTLVTLYLLGAGIAITVCTRTFVSFHIFVPESQASVQLPGHESLTLTARGILEELRASIHTLRASNPVNNASSGHRNVDATREEGDESEPEFLRNPNPRPHAPTAAELQSVLKRMTSRGRKQWLAEHWSEFQIAKVDDVSVQFQRRMRRFLCPDHETRSSMPPGARSNLENDEREICQRTESGGRRAFCKLRFFLTWMSPASSFGPRERLTVESIFKWHPTACVVVLSRTLDSAAGRQMFAPLVTRGYRLAALTPDLEALFADMPAAEWFRRLRDGAGDPGSINLMQNLSNLVRLAALYKYGGVYLDSDVVVLKPFDELRNVVGSQSQDDETGRWTRLNNAVLVFDRRHPVVWEFLREFAATFDGSRWGWNGPYLVSRVMEKVKLVQRWGNCSSVSVLPPQAFYPVNWINVVRYFERPRSPDHGFQWQAAELQGLLRGSFAVHLWNTKSRLLPVEKGSLMETLFKHSCLFCHDPVAQIHKPYTQNP